MHFSFLNCLFPSFDLPIAEVGVEIPEDALDHTSENSANNADGTKSAANKLEGNWDGFSGVWVTWVSWLHFFVFQDFTARCISYECDDDHGGNCNDVADEVDNEQAKTSINGFLLDQDEDVGWSKKTGEDDKGEVDSV